MTWWPTLHVFLVGKRVVGDGRHLPEERPAVLDQLVSNPLAFSDSPHATLRFPKLPRRGCETTAGSTEGWSNHLAFRIAGELWRRRDERQKSESSAAGDCLKGTLTTSGPPGYCRIGANSRPRSVEGRYAVPPVPARELARSSLLQLMWCGVSSSPVRRAATVIRLEAGSVTPAGLPLELRRPRPGLASSRQILTLPSTSPRRSSRPGLPWRASAST